MDFKYDKIFNGWIALGILLGIFFRIYENGWHGIYSACIAMTLSFILLYPVYKIGGLGAGDVKMFIMTGAFTSIRKLFSVIIFSFIIGSVFSIGKIASERNFKERMQYLFSYLFDILHTGQWKLYEENHKTDNQYKTNKIHFALPICISVMLALGGLI